MKRNYVLNNLFVALVLFSSAGAADAPPAMSPAARTYLEQALDLMQQHALNRKSIDWEEVRRATLDHASGAQTTTDTYPAIGYALSQLKEHHSFLQLPDSLPVAQKQAIEAQIDKLRGTAAQGETSRSPFAPSKEISGHMDHNGGKGFGHIIVPMCIPKFAEWEKNADDFQKFADQLHDLVVALQSQKPDGWIVDLRGNSGGNMWPMLAGIGDLIGEGDLGTFEAPDDSRTVWFYKGGKAGTRNGQNPEEIASSIKQPSPFSDLPWVAVLLDRSTASSGEAIAISLAGRKRSRSFGEHTAGFSTSNQRLELSDGAALFLCEGVEADRTGRQYLDGIEPDVKLSAPDTRPAEDRDLVLQTAEAWLGH